MSKQHYLPATYIAFFSSDNFSSRRDRKIHVGFKDSENIIEVNAGHICKIKNYYDFTVNNLHLSIDNNWSYFEGELEMAVDLLANRNLSAFTWASVLVPFVASLFIRGPDFENRLYGRIPGFWKNKMTNFSRVSELQRLLPIIAVSKWVVTRMKKENPLITNDLGYTISQNFESQEKGISIPFASKNIVLHITPKIERKLILSVKNEWIPIIEYPNFDGPYLSTESFNNHIDYYAQQYIIGENVDLIKRYLTRRNHLRLPLDPNQIGFPIQFGRQHELTWFNIIDFIKNVSPKEFPYAKLDLRSVPSGGSIIRSPVVIDPNLY